MRRNDGEQASKISPLPLAGRKPRAARGLMHPPLEVIRGTMFLLLPRRMYYSGQKEPVVPRHRLSHEEYRRYFRLESIINLAQDHEICNSA